MSSFLGSIAFLVVDPRESGPYQKLVCWKKCKQVWCSHFARDKIILGGAQCQLANDGVLRLAPSPDQSDVVRWLGFR